MVISVMVATVVGKRVDVIGEHYKNGHKKKTRLMICGKPWFNIDTASGNLLFGNTCQALKQMDCIHCFVTP